MTTVNVLKFSTNFILVPGVSCMGKHRIVYPLRWPKASLNLYSSFILLKIIYTNSMRQTLLMSILKLLQKCDIRKKTTFLWKFLQLRKFLFTQGIHNPNPLKEENMKHGKLQENIAHMKVQNDRIILLIKSDSCNQPRKWKMNKN